MAKLVVKHQREETPAEKAMYEWFQKQSLASPDTLDEAARLIIGLVTGLLGVLFTVLAIANNPLPAYLQIDVVRKLGALVVVLLLIALIAGLAVVYPRRWVFNPMQPASEARTFEKILNRKASALLVALIAFGAGVVALGAVLVIVLANIG